MTVGKQLDRNGPRTPAFLCRHEFDQAMPVDRQPSRFGHEVGEAEVEPVIGSILDHPGLLVVMHGDDLPQASSRARHRQFICSVQAFLIYL